jgi:nucleotidyltransferase/DNA polymerase involved in DNA repair
MLREKLKQKLDKLNEEQLKKIANFIAFIEFQDQQVKSSTPALQKITPAEQAKEFRQWVAQLPKNNVSLSNEAFSRESIYE